MADLKEILLAPEVRPNVVADGVTLVEEEVSDKGLIIKGAYKTVTTFASGIIRDAVDTLLPDMLVKLQPFWSDFQASGGGDFGDFLAKNGEAAPERCQERRGRAAASGRPRSEVRGLTQPRPRYVQQN